MPHDDPQSSRACPLCQRSTGAEVLDEARWLPRAAIARIRMHAPAWWVHEGACPACVQQALLETWLDSGDNAFHDSVQRVWPLDAQAAFGALPAPLRLHADPRFLGRGITLALIDAGFHPHGDLVEPDNRIRAWVDASGPAAAVYRFHRDERPEWPGWDGAAPRQWHGLMTSTVAAGNGRLAHGLYRGLAAEAELVLLRVMNAEGRVTNESITRALDWVIEHGPPLGVRIVSLSVAGDPVSPLAGNPVDRAVERLVRNGVTVLAAAGNDGERRLVPPATAPFAITVGGLDDRNLLSHDERRIWHSNYGETAEAQPKPDVVAPSIWVVAPILPGSDVAREAARLFERRAAGDDTAEARLGELKLVTPHYQHVEGTSFAAPLVAGIVACMLEANPALSPRRVRELLVRASSLVPGAAVERQGAGAVDAGRAVTLALADRHSRQADYAASPIVTADGATILLHEHEAGRVEVFGSWNGWQAGLAAREVEPGLWEARQDRLPPGTYGYKFLLDGARWLVDPGNPARSADGAGNWNSVLRFPAS